MHKNSKNKKKKINKMRDRVKQRARGRTQGGAKGGSQFWVHKTQFIFVLLFINYYKPTFAPPSIPGRVKS